MTEEEIQAEKIRKFAQSVDKVSRVQGLQFCKHLVCPTTWLLELRLLLNWELEHANS